MNNIKKEIKDLQDQRIKEMIDLAKSIQDMNPGVLLSGSLALYLQGCDIRRFPEDIDFFLPNEMAKPGIPKMPDGFKELKLEWCDETTYEEYDFVRLPFKKPGEPKVEFFYYNQDESMKSDNVFEEAMCFKTGLKMLHKTDIMQLKIHHCISEQGNPLKHKWDIIHFLTNN